MVDVHSKQTRSRNMAAIRSSKTAPELLVHNALDELGVEYSTNVKNLPASPDLVINKERIAILVQGCFWHGHQCYLFHIPSTRREFWIEKINSNIERDREKIPKLIDLDYRVLLIWECCLKGKKKLNTKELQNRIEEYICGAIELCEIDYLGIREINHSQLPTLLDPNVQK